MELLVSGPTGLQGLRQLRYRHRSWASNRRPVDLRLSPPTETSIAYARALLGSSGAPLSIAVSRPGDRRRLEGAWCEVCSRTLPARSIIDLDERVGLPSPELLFLQMHAHLDDVASIALGFELCGHYCRQGTEVIAYELPPATTPDALRRYLNRSPNVRHCARARRNLRFVRASSASPRETQLAMLLSLPHRYGGYGFANPLLNRPIDVSTITGNAWGSDMRRTDLSWEGTRVAVEYDSSAYHSGSEKIERDAKRRTLLQAAGYHVVVVTNDQLKKIKEMDRIGRTLSRLMGKRQRIRVQNYEKRKRLLHNRLLQLDL